MYFIIVYRRYSDYFSHKLFFVFFLEAERIRKVVLILCEVLCVPGVFPGKSLYSTLNEKKKET